jgi:hypothetical protein
MYRHESKIETKWKLSGTNEANKSNPRTHTCMHRINLKIFLLEEHFWCTMMSNFTDVYLNAVKDVVIRTYYPVVSLVTVCIFTHI